MTTRCDVCKLIRTLSTVISTMYLTPSVMAGILRVFIACIVHPSEGYAQITTPVLLCFYSRSVFFIIALSIEYNKTNALFTGPFVKFVKWLYRPSLACFSSHVVGYFLLALC